MNFLHTILSIVFPVKCVSCGKSGTDFCSKCLADCPAAERESVEWMFPLYDYRDPGIKKSVWLLKYKGNRRLADIFAGVLYDRMLEELSDLSVMENFRDPILIPIPLSQKRRRERGYNQSELIAEKLMALDEKSGNFRLEKNILIRFRDSEHQARIEKREERLQNVVGAFTVTDEIKIKNKNIVLIDDVTTTGATLNEARKILKKYGARKIIAFTVAH